MSRYFRLLLLLVIPLIFSQCSKKDDKIVLNSNYSGTFNYQLLSSLIKEKRSGPVTINFSENNYRSSGNSNRIPAGGFGTYQTYNQLVVFKDVNLWTADFDYGLVLNGDYNLERKGDSLILTKTSSTAQYQYRLKRTN